MNLLKRITHYMGSGSHARQFNKITKRIEATNDLVQREILRRRQRDIVAEYIQCKLKYSGYNVASTRNRRQFQLEEMYPDDTVWTYKEGMYGEMYGSGGRVPIGRTNTETRVRMYGDDPIRLYRHLSPDDRDKVGLERTFNFSSPLCFKPLKGGVR